MQRPEQFVKWKFNRMLAVATVVMAVNYVVMLSGSVIVGNLVGPAGLAGVNACTPIFGVASFLASLLSVGTALVFSRAMGAFDAERAAGIFSQSMLLALGLGVAIFAAMHFGETAFLDLTGITDAVRTQAERYWQWQSLAMALLPAVLTLEALVYADGDGTVALAAGGVHVLGAIGLAAFCTWRCGDAGGASLGTAVTMLAVLLACSVHFCRRNNHLAFRRHFSPPDIRETLAASLADSTIYLCWGALVFAVNRFTVAEYGQHLLPLVALAASIVEFSIVFDGVGEALIPLGGMYDGEANRPAMRTLANHAALVATAEGVVCGVAGFVLAPLIASWYGFRGENALLASDAVFLVRTLACAMPFMGLMMMMNTHYLVVHHLRFAVSVTVMKDFACPCAGVLLLSRLFGQDGLWIGFAAGYAIAAAYPFLFVLVRHGRSQFPWLIGRDDGRAIAFTVRLTTASLASSVARIRTFLQERGIRATDDADATVEAIGRATIAANPHPVRMEYFVSAEKADAVRIVMRDNGKPLVSNRGKYLNTLGCNRTECRFDIICDREGRSVPGKGDEK